MLGPQPSMLLMPSAAMAVSARLPVGLHPICALALRFSPQNWAAELGGRHHLPIMAPKSKYYDEDDLYDEEDDDEWYDDEEEGYAPPPKVGLGCTGLTLAAES